MMVEVKSNYKIIVVIIIALVFMLVMATLMNQPRYQGGGASLDGISVYLDGGYHFDLREDFHLNNESISTITNETFRLRLTLDNNQTIVYPSFFHNDSGYEWVSLLSNRERISIEPQVNETHSLSIEFIINSTQPDISGLNIFGNNNTINCQFYIEQNWDVNITMDEDFEHISDNITYDSWYGAMILLNPTEIDYPCEIVIRTEISCD